jgi:hypothetical protein
MKSGIRKILVQLALVTAFGLAVGLTTAAIIPSGDEVPAHPLDDRLSTN